jgi:hypothetical protein
MLNNEQSAIAVYNADIAELVGIFSSQKLAVRYIFGPYGTYKDNITKNLAKKNVLRKNRGVLGFNVAVRYASEKQKAEILGNNEYIIVLPGAPDLVKISKVDGNEVSKARNPNQQKALKASIHNIKTNRTYNQFLNELIPVRL